MGSCWWNVMSDELKGFNTLKGLVFLHIIPETRKSSELMNGHDLRSDVRQISWTSGTVNVTVAHQWTAQTQVHPYVLALLFRKRASWSWYKAVVRSQRVEFPPRRFVSIQTYGRQLSGSLELRGQFILWGSSTDMKNKAPKRGWTVDLCDNGPKIEVFS